MKLYSDNKSAISIAHNPIHHDKTKHVEIDRHLIKEKIEEGTISLSHMSTKFQEADFTKAMPRLGFKFLVDELGMIDIYCRA